MTAPTRFTSDFSRLCYVIFPLAAFGLAVIIFLLPLQLYFPMGRYQHYGLAVFVWGMGYLLQVIWTWRLRGTWSRASYVLGSLYLSSLGLFFYANPWLDPKYAVQTAEQIILRFWMSRLYLIMLIPLLMIWFMGFAEELKEDLKQRKQRKQQEL